MKTVEVRLCEHALSSGQGGAPKGVDMILPVQFAKWAERSSASLRTRGPPFLPPLTVYTREMDEEAG